MAMDLSNDNLNPFESEREIPGNAPGFPGFGAVPDIETRISIDIRISNLDTRITLNIEHWLARNNQTTENKNIILFYYIHYDLTASMFLRSCVPRKLCSWTKFKFKFALIETLTSSTSAPCNSDYAFKPYSSSSVPAWQWATSIECKATQ